MEGFPDYPEISEELLDECQRTRDPRPILFEWFKHIAEVVLSVGSVAPETSGYLIRPPLQRAVVEGMTNRCARLMVSIGKLVCEGKGGESAAILSRCVFETSILIRWLTESEDPNDVLNRYIISGLKSDLDLEEYIESCVDARGGRVTIREQRMLDSIESSRSEAGFDKDGVKSGKGMPDLKTIMLEHLGLTEEHYLGIQKAPSNFVHGSWNDLRSHYIRLGSDGKFVKKDVDEALVHPNVLTVCAIQVAQAARSAFSFLVGDPRLEDEFDDFLQEAEEAILSADSIKSKNDNDLLDVEET